MEKQTPEPGIVEPPWKGFKLVDDLMREAEKEAGDGKKLNFGSGRREWKGWTNIDIQEESEVSWDLNKIPYPFEDNTFDYVFSNMVLEHLDCPDMALEELWRICKPGAKIWIITGHYNNKGAFDCIGHRCWYSELSFKTFVERPWHIDDKLRFRIIELYTEPTKIGRWIPKWLRDKLSLFFMGLQGRIFFKVEVLK